jgi:DNA-binding CsgD family transcriptional regulator
MAARLPWRGYAPVLRGRGNECGALDRLIEAVRAGASRVLVVRGEPGVGKTALLDYLSGHAPGCRVVRAVGAQPEMELAFAGLHQLCAPMLDHLDRLPVPQRDALRTAFGISPGAAPNSFFTGLAVLGLLSEVAGERPLVCVVDDEQWLDRMSAQVLGFVARRLAAEPVSLVFGARDPGEELAGLPQMTVQGLGERDARALLDSVLTGPVDSRVCERIIAETHGNPLALLELPWGLTPEQLAGGFGLPSEMPLTGRIEDSFRRQLSALPAQTGRLLLLAAADPSGDPLLVWRAAAKLSIPARAATSAVEAGLVEFGTRVRFRHSLARSAAYRSASLPDRQEAHGALAEATDAGLDPDRRAWHRAQAAAGPDEEVAAELERSAGRAQRRGGLAAAAAFLERAALLTPAPARRAQRMLTAAQAKYQAGALDPALELLVVAEVGPLDALRAAQVEHLRGQIAFDQQRGAIAPRLLLGAARLLDPLNPCLAREAHLEALMAAVWAGGLGSPGGVRKVAEAALAAPPAADPPRAADAMLDAIALRFTHGYVTAAPALTRALKLLLALDSSPDEARRWQWLVGARSASALIAVELWDFESWRALAASQVQAARDTGASVRLQFALTYLARAHLLAGDLAAAAELLDEDRLIADATGNPPIPIAAMMLAAWRGRELEAAEVIEATMKTATVHGGGSILVDFADHANSVLYNGLGRHDAARDAARRAYDHDQLGFGPFIAPELAEAASRTGDDALVMTTLEWLSERARVTPTDWALGIQARLRALLGEGQSAGRLYCESIDHLGRAGIRAELARSHLLYGEWLRRQGRRIDAREQLRAAYGMLDTMGMEAFAERARRELAATGETVRKRAPRAAGSQAGEASDALTVQEAQVARLAYEGLSNTEISTRLFISPRTVQYHLSKVFTKLDISSRGQLHRVLPGDPDHQATLDRAAASGTGGGRPGPRSGICEAAVDRLRELLPANREVEHDIDLPRPGRRVKGVQVGRGDGLATDRLRCRAGGDHVAARVHEVEGESVVRAGVCGVELDVEILPPGRHVDLVGVDLPDVPAHGARDEGLERSPMGGDERAARHGQRRPGAVGGVELHRLGVVAGLAGHRDAQRDRHAGVARDRHRGEGQRGEVVLT